MVVRGWIKELQNHSSRLASHIEQASSVPNLRFAVLLGNCNFLDASGNELADLKEIIRPQRALLLLLARMPVPEFTELSLSSFSGIEVFAQEELLLLVLARLRDDPPDLSGVVTAAVWLPFSSGSSCHVHT